MLKVGGKYFSLIYAMSKIYLNVCVDFTHLQHYWNEKY